MRFDFERFLRDQFRSPSELSAFLRAFRAPHPGDAVLQKWFQRRSVPSVWLTVLIAYKEIDDGAPLSLLTYFHGALYADPDNS